LRYNLRRYREKASAIAPVRFEVSETADSESLDSLVDLHGARWTRAGETGMIHANRSEAFIREVAGLLGSCGALRVFTLRFADRIAAIILALCNSTAIFAYMSGFDPQHERFGFGKELLAQALQYAHERGYR